MDHQMAIKQVSTDLIHGEDANWNIARLTYEHTKSNKKEPDRLTMAEWCQAIREESSRKFSVVHGKFYKAVWAKYQQWEYEIRPSWADAYQEVQTVTPIPETSGTSYNYRQSLSGDQNQDQVEKDPQEPNYFSKDRREARHNAALADDPTGRRLEAERTLLDVEKLLRTFAKQARELVAKVGTLSERSLRLGVDIDMKQSFISAEEALTSIRTLITTGQTDLDHFLSGVLKGES